MVSGKLSFVRSLSFLSLHLWLIPHHSDLEISCITTYRPLNDKGIKGFLMENVTMVEKLNELFAPIFTMETVGPVPMSEAPFLGRVFEEQSQIKVTRNEL